MANPLKAEFSVFLGETVTARITMDVIAMTERATGTRLATAMQQGALSIAEMENLVLHAAKERIGGLTLQSVKTHLRSDKNRGLYLRVLEALAGFYQWFMGDDNAESSEGEAMGGSHGTGSDS